MTHLLLLALLLFIAPQVRGGSLATQGGEVKNHARRMLAGGEEKFLRDFVAGVRNNHPYEKEFIQAVEEVAQDLQPVLKAHPELSSILEAISEPDRIISFRVSWMDDEGKMQVNRGYRVQFNSALGPYKGGLRFHPGVTQSVLKFLAFEQVFKNALTGLSIGGGKGGSDFDPKGKSDGEIMRFCQSFMTELFRHIGAYTDIPAGDIGVGGREIGYLWGQYKRLKNVYEGALTGKACENGGILMRPESTGFGAVYFANEAIIGGLAGKRCCVSGSGNVALFCARKLLDKGAKCVSLSDSSGTIIEPSGFSYDQLTEMQRIKGASRTARVSEYLKTGHASTRATFTLGGRPWSHPCDLAFPCATQNELNKDDADKLISNGCKGVFEGANMPCTPSAVNQFLKNGKAINAGGVAVSALEMAQHAQMEGAWDGKKVDNELQAIMKKIYLDCKEAADEYGQPGNLKFGANVFAFKKVARACLSQGIV